MIETLAIILICLIFFGTGLAFTYMWVLTRFFNELREREPDVWNDIGRPSLTNMLFLPFINFHKYFAFIKVLPQRQRSGYKYAVPALTLLITGLMYVAGLFCYIGFYVYLLDFT